MRFSLQSVRRNCVLSKNGYNGLAFRVGSIPEKEGVEMATSSILENITINNPQFIELYVESMESSKHASASQQSTKTKVVIADADESKRLSDLRRAKRANEK